MDESEELIPAIRRLAHAQRTFAARRLEPYGLNPVHGAALRAIGQGEPITHSQLAAECDLVPPNLTAVVDRLMDADLIRRERWKHDRRVGLLSLTDQGRAVLPAINAIWADIAKLTTAGRSASDIAMVQTLCTDATARLLDELDNE